MALRAVLGDGATGSRSAPATSADRVVVAGAARVRARRGGRVARSSASRTLDAGDLSATPTPSRTRSRATGATAVYIHVDLDVLDPAEITG